MGVFDCRLGQVGAPHNHEDQDHNIVHIAAGVEGLWWPSAPLKDYLGGGHEGLLQRGRLVHLSRSCSKSSGAVGDASS